VVTVCVSFKDRIGQVVGSVTTSGSSAFDACANAIDFFNSDSWIGPKPLADTILEIAPVGHDTKHRVRVKRVLEWRAKFEQEARRPNGRLAR
jgi:hypothetical protein